MSKPGVVKAPGGKPRARCINLYAGPGVGKSTTMALLYGELKLRGVSIEMATEYAKELVWHGENFDQQHIFAVQKRRVSIACSAGIIVTDGPLLQQRIYTEDEQLRRRIREEYERYDNFDILLTRSPDLPYDPRGRYASLNIALEVDAEIREMLTQTGLKYKSMVYNGRKTCSKILNDEDFLSWLQPAFADSNENL